MEDDLNPLRRFNPVSVSGFRQPETPRESMEFLSRSWSVSALEVSKALSNGEGFCGAISEDITGEMEESKNLVGNPFTFASSVTSQLVIERIMSHSEVSPLTSGRLSHSSGPLNGGQSCGSLSDSPPLSPSEIYESKFSRLSNTVKPSYRTAAANGGKTVGRWLKDRKEKKKEETRAHNAQLHAAVSVAGVAAAVAAMAAATAASSSSGKDDSMAKTDMAVASAATLVAAQCVEAAESLGVDREHLASVVSSAVNVRTPGDIMTLTAAAATALRGAATLKARALKEVWNIAAVIPVEKAGTPNYSHNRRNDKGGSINAEFGICDDNFLGLCTRELLSRGSELLKRTRKGDLHWKMVSVYINRFGQVILKMKSRHVGGTITKKKKNVVFEVCKDIPSWSGRHLLEGGEQRRYFGLRTEDRGLIEFECRDQREYEMWTLGISRLLAMAHNEKRKP